jgi:uridine kinase
MWEGVCAGEREYINPYRDTADYKIDSVMDYEPGVYRTLLTPFLEKELKMQVQNDGDITFAVEEQSHDEILEELLRDLSRFDALSAAYIPEDSVVREFLGVKE